MQLHCIARAIAGWTAGAALVAGSGPAAAQAESTPPTQRIEITGSSIKRIDGETALPVQVLTREDIQRSGASTVEQLVKTVTTASSSGSLTASSTTGATTGGLSSISLRGLGSLRTLVLLNGRRLSPYGIGFTGDSVSVDVSSIPLAAIERVEILKDGASAVYGSDAIAGVVNFILRRNYNGTELSGEIGDSTAGGAAVQRGSIAWGGGDLARDRYNLFLVANLQREKPLYGRDRDFASSSVNLATLNDGTSGNTFPANIVLLDGTGRLRNPNYPDCAPSVVSAVFEAVGLSNRCRYDPSPVMALLPDQQRASVYGALRVALDASTEAYAEASLYRGKQRTVIQPVPLSDQFALPDNHPFFNLDPYNGASTIVLRPSSTYYPTSYVQGLVGAGNPLPDLLVRYRSVLTGLRDITDVSTAPRVVAGLKGTLFDAWDYDAALLYSASKVQEQVNGGFPALTRILPLLNSGRVNFFGPNTPDVVAEALATNFKGTAFTNETSLAGATLRASRDLMDLAGGPVSIALGADARRETYSIDPDPAIQSGDISGYGGNFLPVDRARKVAAVFAELNLPWFKGLETGLAVRHDRYQGSGSSTTPKISLRWQPQREWLLRAAVGKGFRAPSLGDLYSPQLSGVTVAGLNDPVRCPVTGDTNDCGTQFPVLTGGNTALKPEKSLSTTLGVVLEPTRELSVGIDFFRLRITDVLTNGIDPVAILGDLDKYGYLVTRDAPDAAFPNLPGRIRQIQGTNINLGSVKVKGVDLDANWRLGAGEWGRFAFGLTGTYFIQFDAENVDGSFASAIDAPNTATGGLVSRWRHRLSANWTRGPWEATLAQNYQKSYRDIPGLFEDTDVPGWEPRRVSAYQTWDAQLGYTGFKNLRLMLGVRNLFDRDPPFTNTGGRVSFQAGYDPQYGDPRGRFVYARGVWSF